MRDRHKAAEFFIGAFGYRIQQEFEITFDNGEKAKCIAMEPPEKPHGLAMSWTSNGDVLPPWGNATEHVNPYHIPPEIFVSDGTPGSIVDKWVESHNGGGVHHMAYQVDDVTFVMDHWKKNGWATFTSEKPFVCEGLTQVFTEPHPITGVVYEFIQRAEKGFCAGNVKALMESTDKH